MRTHLVAIAAVLLAMTTSFDPARIQAAETGAATLATTTYDFYLGGLRAGELQIGSHYEAGRYSAHSSLKTVGLVGLIYRASFEAEVDGLRTPDGLSPRRFAAESQMRSKAQSVEMIFAGNAPRKVHAEPPFDPRPWQIDPAEQTGTLDPITAALSALAPAGPGPVCNTTVEIFDGRRRYAVDLGAPEVDGKHLRCPALYRRIAGFKPKMMQKRSAFDFNVWFEESPDGAIRMVRAAGSSMLGLAVIQLRD